MDELLEQFLIEAPELIEQASADLLALERNSRDTAALDSAFRAVHTLKGSVALFDFGAMGHLLHAAEGLLDELRKDQSAASTDNISVLLRCVSACDAWVRGIAQTERLPQSADEEAARLTSAIRLSRGGREKSARPETEDWHNSLVQQGRRVLKRNAVQAVVAARYVPAPDCFFDGEDPVANVRSVPRLLALNMRLSEKKAGIDSDPYKCSMVFEFVSSASIGDVRKCFSNADVALVEVRADDAISFDPGPTFANASARTMRVDATRVDRLADMVGELIVAKNEYAHLISMAAERDVRLARALTANQAIVERLTGEMHGVVNGLRMVPLSRTLRRFPRLVRDLADRLGKQVTLSIEGDELEADKVVVDGLYDPLLHLLRNAIDHGIETSDERTSSRKPGEGSILLAASRAGDEIIVSVSDDGAGIDAGKVRKRAEQMGLMSVAELENMTDVEALDLIFAPGFTTSSSVTEVSGRGVGMDAVRTAAQSLGGRTVIASTIGQGTTVRLAVPQAVLVTTVLVISAAGERFGVPIAAVSETTRIRMDRVSRIRSGAAFVLRDRTIPLVRLDVLLGLSRSSERRDYINALIVRTGPELVGLQVDAVAERIDVLVRPMTGLLAAMPGALGTALMGDGSVLIVLNIEELVDDNSH